MMWAQSCCAFAPPSVHSVTVLGACLDQIKVCIIGGIIHEVILICAELDGKPGACLAQVRVQDQSYICTALPVPPRPRLQDNLRREQRATMDINCCTITRILNPVQAAVYMVEVREGRSVGGGGHGAPRGAHALAAGFPRRARTWRAGAPLL